MRFIHHTLLLFVLFIHSSFSQNKNEIIWKEGVPLTWKDFQGKVQKRFAAASTVYKIVAHLSSPTENKIHVIIHATFYKEDSWKNKSWINEQVLEHEQKHFDIVELFARKLRKKVSEMKVTDPLKFEEEYAALHESNNKEMDIYQDLYDEETDGSMNGDKQREWNRKISEEIKSLDNYQNYRVAVDLSS